MHEIICIMYSWKLFFIWIMFYSFFSACCSFQILLILFTCCCCFFLFWYYSVVLISYFSFFTYYRVYYQVSVLFCQYIVNYRLFISVLTIPVYFWLYSKLFYLLLSYLSYRCQAFLNHFIVFFTSYFFQNYFDFIFLYYSGVSHLLCKIVPYTFSVSSYNSFQNFSLLYYDYYCFQIHILVSHHQ